MTSTKRTSAGSRVRHGVVMVVVFVLAITLTPGLAHADNRSILSVTAENGMLTVDLATSGQRSIDDFTITVVAVDQRRSTAVEPIQMWVADGGRTVQLQIPAQKPERATAYSYRVAYAGEDPVPARRFGVGAAHELTDGSVGKAVLVQADDASPSVEADVTDLQRLIEKATGAELAVIPPAGVDAARDAGMTPIWVGASAQGNSSQLAAALSEVGEQGYVIDSNANSVTLLGNTDLGTHYAVVEFEERFLGVRWVMAGDIGEDVPSLDRLLMPQLRVVEAPAIESRVIHPLHTAGNTAASQQNFAWGQRARVNSTIEGYSHNLWRIFQPRAGQPSEDWGTTHPEYYPVRNGEPFIPTTSTHWQPQFTEPGTVQAAIDWINDYFDANPAATSFSLAVNDSGGFAEAEPDHPANPHRTNSFGYSDMSDIYYTWVNQVVEGVLAEHPDKWFGLLAYREVADPPSFPLNPRVVPYLTKERLTWIDEGIRTADQARMAGWQEISDNIAYYDYAYGARYMVPRTYPHHMASYLQYGVDHGLRAYFGESDPTWGEGPKLYEMARLLWNPYRNVDRDLEEWYLRTVGTHAAPYLEQYFELWEDFWTRRIADEPWFESRKGLTYLSFYVPSYLEGVTTADIVQARSLLEAALANTQTEVQRQRAEVFMKAFEYYEASALSYPGEVTAPQTEAAAMALVDQVEQISVTHSFAVKRIELYEGFKDDPYLWPQKTLAQLNAEWSGLRPALMWALGDYVASDESGGNAVRDRLANLANSEDPLVARYASTILHAADGEWVNANPSFEAGDTQATGWEAEVRNYGTFDRVESDTAALTGEAGLEVHNFYAGELKQTVAVQEGLLAVRLHYFVTSETETVGDTWLNVRLKDASGRVLDTMTSSRTPFMDRRGQWRTISLITEIPAAIDGVAVASAEATVTINGFFEGGYLYLDDFQMVASAPPAAPGAVVGVNLDGDLVTVETIGIDGIPTAEDFSVVQTISGLPAETVTPSGFAWNSDSEIATFRITPPEQRVWDQEVAVRVGYGGSLPRWSSLVAVPGDRAGWTQLAANSSLDQWSDPSAAPEEWTYWRGNRFQRSTDARSGSYAVMCTGFSAAENNSGGGGPRQLGIPITPGRYVAMLRMKAPAGTAGVVFARARMVSADGGSLGNAVGEHIPASASRGEWITVWLDFTIAPSINGQTPAAVDLLPMFQQIPVQSAVVVDDIELWRAPA